MEQLTWAFMGTVTGAVLGAGASIITTLIATSNAKKIQKYGAMAERSEKAKEFQRNNLLELQNAVSISMRLIGKVHLSDMENGQSSLLPEELDNEVLDSNRQLSILTERIADDELRNAVKELRHRMTEVILAKTKSESLDAMKIASFTFEPTMEKLGEVLRNNF